ncbi:hypothetical protein H1230_12295 [Paenibacillus sp. 19GGS1-52]|uniref:hypothetical protein n=1 Tax=Paenibacillus sp. 19GGS1-52 TaxID=2758563 RepID=UPI001EFC027A|nr:hypothetical protein [Paenibacillus sp. 19GGS1-52]ULO09481.1 hypothetical protein H1230_12295 [Paenibacillus sp. 19GGS1-52]
MNYPFVIGPIVLQDFTSEDELIDRCKEWNLLSNTATKPKTYLYKGYGLTLPCEIVGYVDNMTVVVQFENKQQHCIHPSYLKEMQTASFGQRGATASDTANPVDEVEEEIAELAEVAEVAKEIPKKAVKAKKQVVELPEDKLQMTAIVKEFTTVPNHFSDNDDEVIIYEGVSVEGHDLALDEVWSSHSATLKKLELQVGDRVSFEAKVVAKKLTQHPVKYKINNPAKMKKTTT